MHIAYATFGTGPLEIVVVPGFVSAVELTMESHMGPIVERLATIARVTVFDKRGTGLSDRTPALDLDTRMDDLRAVMDAVGIERAHVLGISEGGPQSILFTATFPDRVQSLALYGSFACFVRTDDHPFMPTAEERREMTARGAELWGSGQLVGFFPRDERTDAARAFVARYERQAASPGSISPFTEANIEIDVRAILPSISVPTLVAHPTGDRIIPVEAGRYLASHIPNARLVEFPLDNHLTREPERARPWLDAYEEFLTGTRPAGPVVERVLTTVLFTDIVGSTERASRLGDAQWKQLLDRHDEIVQREVARFRGERVKHTGDGVLARFDGPARAVTCGLTISDQMHALGLEVRAGVHTGEIELRNGDIGGIAVHVGARVMSMAGAGEVLATRTVRDLTAGSGLRFEDRGEHELKGVPDRWQLYLASG